MSRIGVRPRPRRAFQRMAVILTTMASVFIVAQAPASASLSQCGDNRLCAWSDNTYHGIFKGYPSSAPTLGGDNDRFDSLWNRSRYSWLVWTDANNRGTSYCLRPGYVVDVLNDWGLHDVISSVQYTGSTGCTRNPIGNYYAG